MTEPVVQAVKYHVSLLPEDAEDRYLFTVTVAYRGGGRWGVYEGAYEYSSLPKALGVDGSWDWEGADQREDEEWLATHRFTLEQALELAKAKAPEVGIYSHRDQKFMTAWDVLPTVDSMQPAKEEKENS